MDQKAQNPLVKHFRQPAIYVRLPSQGKFYPEGALDMPVTEELPIYPMTTRDEITIRTPDALMNGSAIASIIQSCVPNIRDPWAIPAIDLDTLLIAIRIASYGYNMDISTSCPHCEQSSEYTLDLRNLLDKQAIPDYTKLVEVDGLKFKLKPQDYTAVNKANLMRFQEQRNIQKLTDLSISQEERMDNFNKSINELVDLSNEILAQCTEFIQTEDNLMVNDYGFILEFYRNCESKIVNQVQEYFAGVNEQAQNKTVDVVCQNEECQKDYKSALDFEYSNFFGRGF